MPSELREALTAAGASALIPKIIDPLLLEYMRRISPLVRALPMTRWDADVYYWNQRTALATGGNVTDGGTVPVSTSTFVQNNFQIKHFQVVGAVTGYAQQVTRQVIGDLRQTEIEGAIQGLIWDIENNVCWGNAASTLNGAGPQMDGLDTQVASFSGAVQNALDKAGASLTTAHLDELMDMVQQNAAMPSLGTNWMFVCSTTTISKVAQLMQSQQRFNDKVEVAPGLLVDSYRNIPMVPSSFLSPRSFSMGTVTGASVTATTYGTPAVPNSTTYYYKVAPVIARQGEILPCAEVTITTSTGGPYTNTLSFSTPTGLDGSLPISYKVFRGTSSGAETLLGYVDGSVGLAADGVTRVATIGIADTGNALVPYNSTTIPGVLPAAYYGTNTGVFPLASGLENIYLISRDRNFVIRPYVRECLPVDVYPTTASPDTLPFALVSDCTLAIRGPKYTGRLARVATSV